MLFSYWLHTNWYWWINAISHHVVLQPINHVRHHFPVWRVAPKVNGCCLDFREVGGNHSYQQQQEPWRTTQRRWLKSCHLAPLCCSSCSKEELISPSTFFFCPCSRSCIMESKTFPLTCNFFPCSLLFLAKIPPTRFALTSTSSAYSECDMYTHLWLCKLGLN